MINDFNYRNEYILEDERVLLRPLQEDDYEHLLPIALNEPNIWFYSYKSAAGEDGMKAYINEAVTNRKSGKEYPFIVWDKATKKYAGSTRFYDINLPFKTLQLGYTWYGKEFQRTGVNRHCKYLLLSFAFEELNLERVEFRADASNERSVTAMKAIGCVPEGILRNHMPRQDGNRRDSIILSILKSEWFSGGKERLKEKLR